MKEHTATPREGLSPAMEGHARHMVNVRPPGADRNLAIAALRLDDELTALREKVRRVRNAMRKNPLISMFADQGFWHAHHVDLVIRYNGQDQHFEADWLKDIWYALFTDPETGAPGGLPDKARDGEAERPEAAQADGKQAAAASSEAGVHATQEPSPTCSRCGGRLCHGIYGENQYRRCLHGEQPYWHHTNGTPANEDCRKVCWKCGAPIYMYVPTVDAVNQGNHYPGFWAHDDADDTPASTPENPDGCKRVKCPRCAYRGPQKHPITCAYADCSGTGWISERRHPDRRKSGTPTQRIERQNPNVPDSETKATITRLEDRNADLERRLRAAHTEFANIAGAARRGALLTAEE